jgi:hypothetical protein
MAATRRDILKGIALGTGGLLLQPVLHQLQAQAAGSDSLPMRFVFVLEGNGLPWNQIQPVGIDRRGSRHHKDPIGGTGGQSSRDKGKNKAERTMLVDMPVGEHLLPESLELLNPWKDRVSVINGLSGRVTGGVHSRNFGALGVYNSHGSFGSTGTPQGETIDVALGKRLNGVFKQIGLGIVNNAHDTVVYNCSAWGKRKPMPTQCRPDLAYANLFGSAADGDAKQEFLSRNNLLDFLCEDIKGLRKQVGRFEKEKLDQHLAAYEALRERQSRLNEIESTLRKHAPVVSDKFTSDVETDRLDAHFDIAAASLIGGLTNVVTLASGVGDPYFTVRFGGLGMSFDKHLIGHGGSHEGQSANTLGIIIRRFHFELIARLMKKLEAVPEGNGTMLDNTLIVYLSDAGEAHHAKCLEWPFVLIGDLGGRLKRGRYIEYPHWGNDRHKTIGNLYTTFLHAIGEPREYFGLPDPMLSDISGPLTELLA